jgi:hypothetical protein
MEMHIVHHLELLQCSNRDRRISTMVGLGPIQIIKTLKISRTLRLDPIRIVKATEMSTILRLRPTRISEAMATITVLRLDRSRIVKVTIILHTAVIRHRQSHPLIPTLCRPETSAHYPLRHITTIDDTINLRPAHMAVKGRQITLRPQITSNSRPASTGIRG